VFILQGLSKFPLSIDDAQAFGLPMTVWFSAAWGELMSGIGLLLGGTFISGDRVGDLLTRFSGIVICCIMTGVILIGEPESIWYVLLYDHLHLMLFCGGLFFVLRGNRVK
jgi:putative oxidoreductase